MEMITEVLMAERLGEELEKDASYKAAIAEEQRLYETLEDSLDKEQQNMLKSEFKDRVFDIMKELPAPDRENTGIFIRV